MLKGLSRLVTLGLGGLLGVAALPAAASADWHEPVGGASPINFSATRNADAANLAVIGGTPYVAWNEDTTQSGQGNSSTIHVSQLSADGSSWVPVESGATPISLRSTTSSDNPWLADVGGRPWVAWQEGVSQQDVEIRVAEFSNGSWSEVPPTSSINHPINHDGHGGTPTDAGGDASQPTLADDGTGHPFVSFSEWDPGTGSLVPNENPGQIWVDQLNTTGDGWNEVGGGSANANPSADAVFPRMTVILGIPWVVYWQIVPNQSGPPSIAIDVAHLSGDGQSWIQDGPVTTGAIGSNGPTVGEPSIANVGGTPYVTLTENTGTTHQVVVYSFNGGSWNEVGGAPASAANVDAQGPTVADIDGSPWVSWYLDNGGNVIQTARLMNGAWQLVGTSANDDPTHPASNGTATGATGQSQPAVSLTSVNGIPWVSFIENDETQPSASPQCCLQVRVSRLEPTFLSHLAEPEDTSATTVTKLETYGLPYRVGFAYGPGGSLTHTTSLSPASGDPAFSFTSISGLTPLSLYSYMPVAAAGTPEPLVQGPEDVFVTQATPTQGARGPQGPQGPQGTQGPRGIPGPQAPQPIKTKTTCRSSHRTRTCVTHYFYRHGTHGQRLIRTKRKCVWKGRKQTCVVKYWYAQSAATKSLRVVAIAVVDGRVREVGHGWLRHRRLALALRRLRPGKYTLILLHAGGRTATVLGSTTVIVR